jgi:hypothetical protein
MPTEELLEMYDLRLKIKEDIDRMPINRVLMLYETLRCQLPNLDPFEEIKYQVSIERLVTENRLPPSALSDSKCGSKFNWLWLLLPILFLRSK